MLKENDEVHYYLKHIRRDTGNFGEDNTIDRGSISLKNLAISRSHGIMD